MMASAAYWIGSAADEIYISGDTVNIGSIGVIATHVDYSQMDQKMGVKVTEVVAGKYKNMGSPNMALSKEAEMMMQGQVDHIYSVFVEEVAANRGKSV